MKRTRSSHRTLGTSALLALFCASALASPTTADREFASEASAANAAEIALSSLAATNAQDPAIKSFASHMVSDHTQAAEGLKTAASEDGVSLPSARTSPDVERLAGLHGAEFDHAFAAQMLGDHEKAVALFRKEAAAAGDSAIKAFAAKTLPTIESHLEMAKALPLH